jgi:hypothetical protein
MKDSKQNIRYLGFETTSDGGRRFSFSITGAGRTATRVTLEIPGLMFQGDKRITYQESAKICYDKIRVLLDSENGISSPLHIGLTRRDIDRLRHIPRGQVRPSESAD